MFPFCCGGWSLLMSNMQLCKWKKNITMEAISAYYIFCKCTLNLLLLKGIWQYSKGTEGLIIIIEMTISLRDLENFNTVAVIASHSWHFALFKSATAGVLHHLVSVKTALHIFTVSKQLLQLSWSNKIIQSNILVSYWTAVGKHWTLQQHKFVNLQC